MTKRGLSKSMKKRVIELMKKKKLTVKDKKFLAKLQKGGEWFKPWTWFSSTPTAGQTPDAVAVPVSDDHASMKNNLCKICSKLGADCECPEGPVAEDTMPDEGSVPANSNQPISGEGESMPQPNEKIEGMPQSNEQLEGMPPPNEQEKRMGGRKSRKHKRRNHKKTAKKMSFLW